MILLWFSPKVPTRLYMVQNINFCWPTLISTDPLRMLRRLTEASSSMSNLTAIKTPPPNFRNFFGPATPENSVIFRLNNFMIFNEFFSQVSFSNTTPGLPVKCKYLIQEPLLRLK